MRLSRPFKKAAYVFCGQGHRWLGMGRELIEAEPAFRRVVEAAEPLIRRAAGWSLSEEIRAPEGRSRLDRMSVAQPACFVLQAAAAAVLTARGLPPDGLVGHSGGELAAAYLAGALDLEQALEVALARGRAIEQAAGSGRMAAVAVPLEEAERAAAGRVSVAAVNGPSSTVLSGEAQALETVLGELEGRRRLVIRLETAYAFHSPAMSAAAAEAERALAGLRSRRARLPVYSTVTGERIGREDGEFDGAYWGRKLLATVRFWPAVDRMIDDGFDAFVEIGPAPALAADIRQCLRARGVPGLVVGTRRPGESELETLRLSLERLSRPPEAPAPGSSS